MTDATAAEAATGTVDKGAADDAALSDSKATDKAVDTSAVDAVADKGKGDKAPQKSAEGDKTTSAKLSEALADGLDGELRDFALRFTSKKDIIQAALDLRKANSSMVKVPGKDAKPEDIAKWHKAIGVGEKPEDYAFAMPEGKEATDQDKAFQSTMAQVMHKSGVPVAAAKELNKAWNEMTAAAEAQHTAAVSGAVETARADLRKEWGAEYEANVELARRAFRAFGDTDATEFVERAEVDGMPLADHPAFAKVFAKIGKRMGEHGFVGSVPTAERSSMEDKLNDMTKQMHDAMAKGDSMTANRLNKEILDMSASVYGSGPIVGAGGRSF